MEPTDLNKNNSTEIDKVMMKTWIDFLTNLNKKKDEDIEKVLDTIQNVITDLIKDDFFTKDDNNEAEKFFINSFCPKLIRILINENFTSAFTREVAKNIINLFVELFSKHFENVKFYDIWEAVTEVFCDEKKVNSSCDVCASEKFLELNYELLNINSFEWRSSLKPGQLIDYLFKDSEAVYNKDKIGVASWTRAEIIDIDENKNAMIKLLGTKDIKSVSLVSSFILPYNTLSLDFDKRELLQVGDEIDYLDTRSWYRSTVLSISTKNDIKFIKYGLRIYREHGRTYDSKNKAYIGWGESFDKEVPVHDPKLRVPGEFSKPIQHYEIITSYPIDSKRFNEIETYFPFDVNGYKFFAIPVKHDGKKLDIGYINRINDFIKLGGLNKFLNVLQTKGIVTYEALVVMIDIMNYIKPYLHIKFAFDYIRSFSKFCLDFLLEFSKSDSRNFKRDKLDSLIKKLKDIMFYAYMENDVNAIFDIFGVDFGIYCLNATTLDRKIIGLKLLSDTLNDVVKANTSSTSGVISINDKHINSSILFQKIFENNIIDLIYGINSHIQLIQKSSEFIKNLLLGKALTKTDINKLWALRYSNDLETKLSIYKLFNSNFSHFSNDLSIYMIHKVLETTPKDLSSNDIEVISNMIRVLSTTATNEISEFVCEKYWSYILSNKLSKEINENLINEFINLLKNSDLNGLRQSFIEKILKMVNQNENTIICLKLLRRIVTSINGVLEESNKNKLLIMIFEDYDILNIIIQNLKIYHQACLNELKNLVSPLNSDDEIEKHCFVEEYSHREQLIERINFLNFIITAQKMIGFNSDQVETLFNIFVENAVCSRDLNAFFKFFKDAEEKKLVSSESLQLIFNKMITNEKLEFNNINSDFFLTIWNIFLAINKSKNKIQGNESKQLETYNNVSSSGNQLISYSGNNEYKMEFKVLENPNELDGYELIWKLVLSAPQGDTSKKAITSFLKLFILNEFDSEKRSRIWVSLINKCIETIKYYKNNFKNKSEKVSRISNIIHVMRELIEETEKKGTAGVISHSSIIKNSLIKLKINNNIYTKAIPKNVERKFNLKVYSNTTLWDLKKLLGNRCLIVPECIKVSNSTSKDITENDHGKTLSDLKLKNDDTLTITKNIQVLESIPRKTLVIDGQLTNEFKEVLNEIFNNYSTEEKMNPEECAKFATVAVDSTDNISIEDSRIKSLFSSYDYEKEGFIRLQKFYSFFRDSIEIQRKIHVVWDNVKAFNFRHDLNKYNEPLDEYNCNKLLMPRYLIAKNQEFFNVIFQLQDEEDLIAKEASKLLSIITTNIVIFKNLILLEKILESSKNEGVWNEYLDKDNFYKLLYSLQIVESFFEDFELGTQHVDCEPNELSILETSDKNLLKSNQRLKWIEYFLTRGGLNHLLQVIHTEKEFTNLRKKCFILTIKVIRNALSCLFRSRNQNKSEAILLMRKDSLNQENLSEENKDENKKNKKKKDEKKNEEKEKEKEDNILAEEIFEEKENEIEKELISIINLNYGDSLLLEINFESLLTSLMEIIYNLIKKTETDYDERQIVTTCVNLWCMIIISQENISQFLKFLYEINLSDSLDFETFIMSGILYSNNIFLRLSFFKNFRSLTKTLYQSGENSFLIKLLTLFIKKYFDFNNKDKLNWKFFYSLFEFLLETAFSNDHIKSKIDFNEFALRIVKVIHQEQNMEEENFIGSVKLLNVILTKNKEMKNQREFNDLIKILFDTYIMIEPRKLDFQDNTKMVDSNYLNTMKQNSYNTIDARQALFDFVITLLDNDIKNIMMLFSTKLSIIPSQVNKVKKNYNPQSEKRSMNGYSGIKNLGSICYMNSILQQFYNIPSFRYALLQADDNKELNLTDQNKEKDDNVLHQIQKMFTFLDISNRIDYNPTDFCYSFKGLDGLATNIALQQDAQEFLGRLFEFLENGMKNTNQKYLLNSVFTGKSLSQMICGGCGNSRAKVEDFNFLSIEVKNMKEINDSLEKYISPEKIDEYNCEACKKKVKLLKKNSIVELPNILIFHLQRILFNYDTFMNEKINSKYEFPKQIAMKPYCKNGLNEDEQNSNINVDLLYEREAGYYDYDLVGVVVHMGTADAGHYYSYINIKREGEVDIMINDILNEKDAKWLEFNDTMITSFNLKNLEVECFGGSNSNSYSAVECSEATGWAPKPKTNNVGGGCDEVSKSAYMLVYERKKKYPIKMILHEEVLNKPEYCDKNIVNFNTESKLSVFKQHDIFNSENVFLDCDNTAKSRLSIYESIFYDEDLKEYQYFIPFYSVKKLLPRKFFEESYLDNINFINDLKIFNKNFNEFLDKILINLLNSMKNNEKIRNNDVNDIFKVLLNYLFEVLIKAYNRDNLNKIVDNLIELMKINPEFLNISINFLSKYKSNLIEILFSSEQGSNMAYKNILVETINLYFKENVEQLSKEISFSGFNSENKSKNCVIELLDYLLSLFSNNEAAKNWTKIIAYLEFWQDFARSGDLQLEFLFSREMISKLIDFMLMKESPFYKTGESRYEMGNRLVNPKFAPLITTLSIMLRHSYTSTWTEEDFKNGVKPPTIIEGKIFSLSDNDKIAIESKKFFAKAIKDAYDNSEMSRIIAHLMFNNLEFTKVKLFQLMEIMNDAIMSQDFKNAIDLLYQIFHIEDKYTILRMEWIFGIPQLNTKFTERNVIAIQSFNKYGEKLFKFISPILVGTNNDSLIDKIMRLQSHSEFIMMLTYVFALFIKNPLPFNYFDNLPSPKVENQQLKDYIFELIREELSRPYFNSNKQNEKPIQIITKIMDKYDIYKKENAYKNVNYMFRPSYRIGNISKEFIDLIHDENLNQKSVYLMSLDYECELVSGIEEFKKPKIDDNDNKENEFILLHSDENTNKMSNNLTTNSNYIDESITQSDTIYKEKKYKNVSKEFNYGRNEEEFLKKILKALMENDSIFRIFINCDNSRIYENCLKKIMIYNNSDVDYKIKLKFYCDDVNYNNLIPQSEIVILVKKNSFANVLVLLKEDVTKPWSSLKIHTEIEKYEQNGNKNMFISDESNEKKMKKSKSDPEMTPHKFSASNDAGKDKIEKAEEVITSNIDDGCNYDCPNCFHSNNLSTNTSYICKKCGKDLFG